MSTIAKAMELLNQFSIERPEIGLAEFQRLMKRDKATTYRHLSALVSAGLLEKHPDTQKYRIGAAVLRLAHQREVTMPRRAGVRLVLPGLAEATGETAHATLLEGSELITLAHHESTMHSTRVVMHEAMLPLHATASGMAVLAYAGEPLMKAAIRAMRRFTEHTHGDEDTLRAHVAKARETGFGVSQDGFEAGVHGIAAPLFDASGKVAGAVAVASLSSRMIPELGATIRRELAQAARRITTSWGGTVPQELEIAWAETLAQHAA